MEFTSLRMLLLGSHDRSSAPSVHGTAASPTVSATGTHAIPPAAAGPAACAVHPLTFLQKVVKREQELDALGLPILCKNVSAPAPFLKLRKAACPSSEEKCENLLPQFAQVFAPAHPGVPHVRDFPLDCSASPQSRLYTSDLRFFSVSVLTECTNRGPFGGSVDDEKLWRQCGGRERCGALDTASSDEAVPSGNHPVPLRISDAQKAAVNAFRRTQTDLQVEGNNAIFVRVSFFSDSSSPRALFHRYMVYTASKPPPKSQRKGGKTQKRKQNRKKRRHATSPSNRASPPDMSSSADTTASTERDDRYDFRDVSETVAQMMERDPASFGDPETVAAFITQIRLLGARGARRESGPALPVLSVPSAPPMLAHPSPALIHCPTYPGALPDPTRHHGAAHPSARSHSQSFSDVCSPASVGSPFAAAGPFQPVPSLTPSPKPQYAPLSSPGYGPSSPARGLFSASSDATHSSRVPFPPPRVGPAHPHHSPSPSAEDGATQPLSFAHLIEDYAAAAGPQPMATGYDQPRGPVSEFNDFALADHSFDAALPLTVPPPLATHEGSAFSSRAPIHHPVHTAPPSRSTSTVSFSSTDSRTHSHLSSPPMFARPWPRSQSESPHSVASDHASAAEVQQFTTATSNKAKNVPQMRGRFYCGYFT